LSENHDGIFMEACMTVASLPVVLESGRAEAMFNHISGTMKGPGQMKGRFPSLTNLGKVLIV
jgi:hypothetical protein